MGEWFGWAGRVLHVDLTKEKAVQLPLSKETAYNFLGGRGFNIKTLWDRINPRIDPLGPENVLSIAVGPLNGTFMSMSSRFNVACLSPMTNILGDGNVGGHWGAELKIAGYDQIVVEGRASEPVYLWIDDDEVEIRDASDIWGRTVSEADDVLKEELGDERIRVCCIGPAGEHLVRMASTMADRYRSGSPGSGAVWGSKNLKAIAVRGSRGVKIADQDKFMELCEEDRKGLLEDEFIQGEIGVLGTLWLMRWLKDYKNAQELIDTKEWIEEAFQKYTKASKGCFNCPVHCSRYHEVRSGPYTGVKGASVEHHTLVSMGTFCGETKIDAIYKLNDLCNDLGLCTSPTGRVIALAMEMYEKGELTKEDTDGIPLEWGNTDSEIRMVHKIAYRDGFGNLLAEGDYNFAKRMNALNYCLHIKGYSRYGIRGEHTTLIYHMTSTRGSDHLRGLHLPWPRGPSREEYGRFFGDESVFDPDVWENKHISTVFWQHEYVIADCLERCKCGVNNYHIMCPTAASRRSIRESSKGRAEMLSAATGKVWTPEEIWTLAERVYNLERAFIVRQGITRKHDWPPPKLFSPFRVLPPTLIQSHTTGKPYEPVTRPEILNEMLNRYYSQRGWDVATGIPSYQKLEQLGLDYVAEEFRRNLPYPEWNGPPLWPLDKYPSTKIERIGF